MIVSEGMTLINYAYRGSDDNVPASGSDDYNLWLAMMNVKQSEFANDSKNTWSSLFYATAPYELGTVSTSGTKTLTGTGTYFNDYRVGDKILVNGETTRTIESIASNTSLDVTVAFANTASSKEFTHQSIIATGVQSYNLNRRFVNPSDKIIVNNTEDSELIVVKPKERTEDGCEVYISGMNPQSLTFVDTVTDEMIGGILEVPGYYAPKALTSDSDTINVDNPYWLVYSTASELAFNDLTYENKYADLNAKANNLYMMMSMKNRRGTNGNPKIAPTMVDRILSPEGESN